MIIDGIVLVGSLTQPTHTHTHTHTQTQTQALPTDQSHTETDSMLNGNRTPSLRSQRSVSNEPQDSDTEGTRAQSPQGLHKRSSEQTSAQKPRKRPSIKPKPPLKSSTPTPVTSSTTQSTDHVTSSSSPVTRSSSHVTSSSSHVTSSSSHVGLVIERLECSNESKVTPPRQHRSEHRVALPSVSSLEQTSRPRTHTHPSPVTTPTTASRRLSERTSSRSAGDLRGTLEKLRRLVLTNDCYALLGVESGATPEDLLRARREKSRLLHPDHFAGQPNKKHK